jgi:hypothetical protein
MNRRTLSLILLVAVPTLIYVGMLLFYPNRDLLILWPRDFGVPITTVLLIALATLAYAFLAWRIVQAEKINRVALIAMVIIGGLALQLAVVAATNADPIAEIIRRTYAWKTGGYWTVGAPVTNLIDFIGKYAERAPLYPVHESRHPPGLSLIFTMGTRLFEFVPFIAAPIANWLRPMSCQSLVWVNAPAPQMASGLFGAIAEIALAYAPIIPLYALVKRLAGERAAAWSAVLYALTPGFTQWVTQFDRGVALATAMSLYFAERFIAERKLRHALFVGLTLSVATFMTFGAAPIALIVAVYALVRWLQSRSASKLKADLGFLAGGIGLAIAGLASVWVIAYVFTGLNPITLYNVVFDSHLGIEFPFWPFVFWHPWDMLTMIGLPVAMIVIFAGWRRATALSAAFVIPLLTLSFAHVARGETGRVWLYFTPIAVGATAIVIEKWPRAAQMSVVALLGLHLVVQGALFRTHEYGYWPDSLPQAAVPADATTVDTRFGASGQIALLAYRITPLKPGEEGAITLWWQRMSDEPLDTAYKSFIHVAEDESDQGRVAQHDEMPVRSLYPTTCWAKGQIVEDRHVLRTESNAQAGDYPIFVGLYDPLTNTRPPTFASEPAKQMHGSVLLPTKATVEAR